MLQINTTSKKYTKKTKKVQVDGFGYEVRQPGAGESLFMQDNAKRVTEIEGKINNDTATESEKEELKDTTVELLRICLSCFEAIGHDNVDAKKSERNLNKYDAETLLNIITEVWGAKSERPRAKKA